MSLYENLKKLTRQSASAHINRAVSVRMGNDRVAELVCHASPVARVTPDGFVRFREPQRAYRLSVRNALNQVLSETGVGFRVSNRSLLWSCSEPRVIRAGEYRNRLCGSDGPERALRHYLVLGRGWDPVQEGDLLTPEGYIFRRQAEHLLFPPQTTHVPLRPTGLDWACLIGNIRYPSVRAQFAGIDPTLGAPIG